MKNENLVPKVRFKGFSDPWEQRKLSSVVTPVKSYSITRDNERKSTNTEYIHYGDIHKFTNTIIDDHVTLPNIADGDYIPLNEGDLVLADASEDYVEIAKPLVLFKTDGRNIVSGLHTIALHPHDVESLFLYNVFNSQNFRRYGYKVGTGLKVFGVSSKNILKYSFNSPSMYEQKKIDSILLKLTDLIAANEDKLEQLKTLKKLMMQKIFSQEWRFKGFTDPWEQRKLGELFNERKEKSSQGELLSVTINSGIVKFDTLDRKNNSSADKSNYRVVRYGDIAYNSMRMWQGASGLSMYNGIVSPAYTVITPRTNTDAGFMAVNFKRKSMIQVFQRNSQGLTSDTWNLKFPVLKNIRISIPKITEQQIITELFTVINNLIAANEDKLNQLKKLKKYLMQNMFV
ncbi:restriction endonuclease subunit S [Lactiplantibacillus plantarum]|uniref:restriction endonuclease subunit S n=1 Tax=Lactiplantibacillus plantarum TaxID=1590 RepID=UPI003F7B1A97